jgi:PadR family transcriptional regulator AphA
LLGLLTFCPMSGYDLKKFCDKFISQFWHENYAHIYTVLKELDKEGLAIKKTVQTDSRPLKSVYSITAKGKAELTEWLHQPAQASPPRYEFILKLFFSADVPAEDLIENFKRLKNSLDQAIAVSEENEKGIVEDNEAGEKQKMLWRITSDCGKYNNQAMVRWCNETLAKLETLKHSE